jgi:1-phosphatidylinositol-4-phosphate 5-kinase
MCSMCRSQRIVVDCPVLTCLCAQDYCPQLFKQTRELFKISNASYRQSLRQTAKEKLSEGIAEAKSCSNLTSLSPGASGAFMFFTKDGRYIVKSTSRTERDMLLSIIDQYTQYMSRNLNTYLTRFYGLHAIRLYG